MYPIKLTVKERDYSIDHISALGIEQSLVVAEQRCKTLRANLNACFRATSHDVQSNPTQVNIRSPRKTFNCIHIQTGIFFQCRQESKTDYSDGSPLKTNAGTSSMYSLAT